MEAKNNTTSRALVVLGLVIILILLSAITPAKWLGVKVKKQPYTKLDLRVMTSPSEFATDTNNDGKVGWNEIVTSTLKNSTTSLANINQKPINQRIIDDLNDPNNLTSSFSKNVYLATAYLKEKGITDESSKQEAVNYLIAQEAAKITITSYTLKDIKVAKNESKDSIKLYGNNIAPIIKDLISSEVITGDMVSVNSFIETQEVLKLLPLSSNKKRIDSLIQKLLGIEVPASAITYHLLMINRLAYYSDILASLAGSDSDPVRGTLMLNNYQEAIILVIRTPNQFYDYFNMQNIIFTSKEAGYIFTSGFNFN
ncbi:hypothetical protein K9M47_04340 [Candidatus Gracilibacteria bacterium]|nr:hypothetical protein [Candidatus Gracilibacteria bacterium]